MLATYAAPALVVLALVGLVVASIASGGRGTGCCCVSDPAKDLRMRAAWEDDIPAPGSAKDHHSSRPIPD